MGKEQSQNFDLKDKSEAELRSLLKLAELDHNYELQLKLCRVLLPFEERPCLALTAIKDLKNTIDQLNSKKQVKN